ncbi:hypothetical protein AOL_s00210g83 [Orbilia oligospora ATCC 24927]|uniref:Zn(2)-C6 fungal-type domain-containing protein n=1 Tax=Arthrobotrys oligospora (strain ATCC 24927 / CBS 115.81 / DSM 1491) TaxID=756982 RepID=G1XRM8_ARTOA|nr:hypothetical protein AOL_s00210g83 [Orbilia oligospora ATCC 24927]EGX44211.1 hypothetical protein AOL_s00210g83 [Orbilia oligospora ATCC 24927]
MATPISSIDPTADDLILLQSVAASLGAPISRFLEEFLGPRIIDDPPSARPQTEYTKEQFSLFLKAAATLKIPIWLFLGKISIFTSTCTDDSTATSSATLGSSSPEPAQSNADLIQFLNIQRDDVIHPASASSIEPLVNTHSSTSISEQGGGTHQVPSFSHSSTDLQPHLNSFTDFPGLFPSIEPDLDPAGIEGRGGIDEAQWNETSNIDIGFGDENLIDELEFGSGAGDPLISFDDLCPQNSSEAMGLPLASPQNVLGVDDAVEIPSDVFMMNTFAESGASLLGSLSKVIDYNNMAIAASSSNSDLNDWQMVLPSCVTNNIFEFPLAEIARSSEFQLFSTMNDFLVDPIPEDEHSILAEAVEKSKSSQRKSKTSKGAAVAGPKTKRIEKSKAPAPTDMALRPKRGVRSKIACMRCKFNKNKCIPNPYDPSRPCLDCEGASYTMTTLPCTYHAITDCILFRTTKLEPRHQFWLGITNQPRKSDTSDDWVRFDFANSNAYPPLDLVQSWRPTAHKTIEISQGYGRSLALQICKYEPQGPQDMDNAVLPHPYCVLDLAETEKAISAFAAETFQQYYEAKVNQADSISLYAFKLAYRMQASSRLLRNCLKMWTYARYMEGGWTLSGLDLLGLASNSDGKARLSDAFIIDFQIDEIFVRQLLQPSKTAILEELQKKILGRERKSWLVIFLACFIILSSVELLIKQQQRTIHRRNPNRNYLNTSLVRDLFNSSKIILSYFHYRKPGDNPFAQDWYSGKFAEKFRKSADLDDEQFQVIRYIATEARKRLPEFIELTKSNRYTEDCWFTGQLFLSDWHPPNIAS